MIDVDSIIQWLQGLPPVGVYAALWFTTYIENIFPPSPSDVILLFISTLIGIGTIGFLPALGVATFGSVMGFLTAFTVGRVFGRRIVSSGKFPFLTERSLVKVDRWFDKYGYGVIIANRFLSGTRAVISFFAGMSRLDFARTTILCSLSALAWNALVMWLGYMVGDNLELGKEILQQYGLVITIILVVVAVVLLVRWLRNRKRQAAPGATGEEETSEGSDEHATIQEKTPSELNDMKPLL